ncbi:penicillin-binding protein 1A [Crocosphaera subtropica ATCC 51142]|uniref:Penicillin-binding protein 1A n=2 Tax=Crocosphaera TaxID=263510 RepID=B1WZY0_CROS5|nr:penicillin-binding protein 1A [Crocosphaera subtropica ATCC 51142]
MLNRFQSKVKQQLRQLLLSMADKLDSDPSTTQLVTSEKPRRRRRRRRENKEPNKNIFTQKIITPLQKIAAVRRGQRFWLFVGVGLGVSSGAITLGYGVYQIETSITESVEDVLVYARPETLTIEGADGEILQQIGPVSHEKLKIWQIPDTVQQAFIASEDSRFKNHRGVDIQGIIRAAFSNFQAGEVVEGGSTITQQLARIVFLNQERSFTRKFKEMRLAQKIENNFTKQQILERYLNLVYLGSGAYGVADAAWVYFSKPIEDLTISEAATLAGIVPAPSLYSPLENKEAAKKQRDLVLERMAKEELITESQFKNAIASPLTVNPSQPKRFARKAPYFTDYIRQQLPNYLSQEVIQAGGITVETTLNTQWQAAAEKAIENAISYGRWQGYKQASLTAIDPRNGQIKVMVGGNDYENNQYNRVTQAKRQPGSTFKAFVYATAIAAGFSPYRTFTDAPYIVDGYRPENYGDQYSGGQVSMRQAIASSLNVVAVQALVQVGWNPIINIAQRMGIQSELKPTYSLALGAWEVNLLELTNAYATLANEGVYQEAHGISRILDRHGKVIYQAQPDTLQAIDANTTNIMTWMLRGVVTSGTGTPASLGRRPVAGKTGTSDQARDLWFVGYIPQLTAGVWLGNDNNKPTWGASTTAARVWGEFMEEATENMDIESFPDLPRLDGRKGSIEAEPLKPKKAYYQRVAPPEPEPEPQARRTTRRRYARRPSSTTQTATPRPQRTVNRSPVRSQTAAAPKPDPNPVEPVVASPTPEVAPPAPPAPPAARKTE